MSETNDHTNANENGKAKKPSRLRRLLLFGCGGLLLIVVCGGIFAVSNFGGEDEAPVEAESEAAVAVVDQQPTEEPAVADAEQASGTPAAAAGQPTAQATEAEADNSAAPEPAATDAPPTETPAPTATATPPPVGVSRGDPYPVGTGLVSVPNWDVEVLEVVRGDEAWSRIQQANQFNDPPPEGMEYVLVQVRAVSTYADGEIHSIGQVDFKLTGSERNCYRGASVVPPEPALRADLAPGGETTGWIAFLARQVDTDLILMVDELANFDDDRYRYLALEEAAAVAVDPALSDIARTEDGLSRAAPIPPGELATTENWQVAIVEVQSGDAAWTAIQAANQFNEPPPEGRQYVLARVRVQNIGERDRPVFLTDGDFNATGAQNILYGVPAIVEPYPTLDACLFPGGVYEGWAAMEAGADEADLMLRFDPFSELFVDDPRFLALVPDAAVTIPADLDSVSPDEQGTARDEPAPLGETVVLEDWEVTVLESIRGSDAWRMAQEANQFNSPPDAGMEYIQVRVRVRYLGEDEKAEHITETRFDTLGDQNVQYEAPGVVEPEPALNARLYPGGSYEGWITMEAAEGEGSVVLVFDPAIFEGERYFSLQP